MAPQPVPATERFWPKVNKQGPVPVHRPELGPCWVWQGGIRGKGYGGFHPTWTTVAYAHVWSYTTLVGPIPEGLYLDHLCRNRLCVNPSHLEPVTNRTNMLRGDHPSAQRARATNCKHGHPYTPENTYITRENHRRCRICKTERRRVSDRRRRAIARIAGQSKESSR